MSHLDLPPLPTPNSPTFSFALSEHDRRHELRGDDEFLEKAWADPETRVLVVGRGAVAMDGDRLRMVAPAEAPIGEIAFLGVAGGRTYLAVMVADLPEALTPLDLRTAGSRLDGLDAGLLVHAVGLANWHGTHPRCSRCGEPTVLAQAAHVRTCGHCGATHFPRTDPAVIMLITDDQGRALLGRQPLWREGHFSTLAGFLEPGEALEEAVRREVREETGVVVGEVRYAGSQPWPFPSSLMVGFFGRAADSMITVDHDEIAEARWFTREELAELARSRSISLPGVVSISRWLIETWYGGELPGSW